MSHKLRNLQGTQSLDIGKVFSFLKISSAVEPRKSLLGTLILGVVMAILKTNDGILINY